MAGEIMVIEGFDDRVGGSRARSRYPRTHGDSSMYDSYDEIMPPMGELGLGSFLDDIWPTTGDAMEFIQVGAGAAGGLVAARWIENMLTQRGLPRFLVPVVDGVIGIYAAKYASRTGYASLGIGFAGGFAVRGVISALDVFFGVPASRFGLGELSADGLGDLLGDPINGYDGIDVSVETRQIGAGGGQGGMGGVAVESAPMTNWNYR